MVDPRRPDPQISRLPQIQAAMRVFALLLNLAALVVCVFLFQNFRYHALSDSTLFIGLFYICILLVASGISFLVWGWLERRRLETEGHLTLDEQTGALTSTAFQKVLKEELRRAGRYHYPVTICLLDLDDFTSFNENFGKEKGDILLRQFSEFLRSTVRSSDTIGRIENDAFWILLPHTDLVRGQKFLLRVLFETQERLGTGFSAGVTSYKSGEKPSDLLARLNLAIHAAKREGKNKIRALVADQDSQSILHF